MKICTHDEQNRLRLLVPIREYVASAHPPEEADQTRAMQHYIGLARSFGPQAGAEGGAEAIVRLATDLANVEAIIRLGLEGTDNSEALAAAIALRDFWVFSGFGTDDLLEKAMTSARDRGNVPGLAA